MYLICNRKTEQDTSESLILQACNLPLKCDLELHQRSKMLTSFVYNNPTEIKQYNGFVSH